MIVAISVTLLCMALGAFGRYLRHCRRREARVALSGYHSCLPSPRLSYRRVLGVDRLEQLLRADSESRLMETLCSWFRQAGNTLEHVLLGTSEFATTDPANIAALLTNNKDFGIEPRRVALLPIFGDGIFTQEGLHWIHSRNTIRRQLQYKQYETLDVFRGAVNDLINVVRESGGVVDLQPLFFRMTLDATTEFLFGESVQSLVAPENSDKRTFADAFDVVQRQAAEKMRRYDFQFLGSRLRFAQARRDLNRITDQILDCSLEAAQGDRNEDARHAFLCAIARDAKDRIALRGQVLNLLAAGRDTTASLLTWTFFLLVRHPSVVRKLRAEIASASEVDGVLSRSNVKSMRYLQSVLRETLRLYPSVPVNFRTATRDAVIPTGGGSDRKSAILIPKGKTVAFCPYALHRRPDLYGLDAALFRPERWNEDMPLLRDPIAAKWGYVPFGAGPRTCLGMDFALTEAAYTIVRLLQEFPKIQLPEDEATEPVGVEKQVTTLVMSIGDGCRVSIGQ